MEKLRIEILPMTHYHNGEPMTEDAVNVKYAGMKFDAFRDDRGVWIETPEGRAAVFTESEDGKAFKILTNTYVKTFLPNVFLAVCPEMHEKGDIITMTTKNGREHQVVVFNQVAGVRATGNYWYSVVRADGFNYQEFCARRAARYENASANSMKKSDAKWDAAQEGWEFLSLGEPIKVGHHSEERHRALIERNHNRAASAMELQRKAEEQAQRAAYWASKKEDINLSMPESVEYYEFKLEEAKSEHEMLKANPSKRLHAFSLSYAKKHVNALTKQLMWARRLWA